jgi:hypothetical protein
MVPGKPAYFKDISYWLPDIRLMRSWLAEQMGIPMSGELEAAAEKADREYYANLPGGLKIVTEAGTKTVAAADGKKDTEQKQAAHKPNDISVMIINSSGINGAGAEAADILRRKGFRISGVETGRTSSRLQTTITTAAGDTGLFYGMPFSCVIMDGGKSGQAMLNIGKDYRK